MRAWPPQRPRPCASVTRLHREFIMLAEVFRWLLTPISGASDHAISRPLVWHGRLMVLAMGLLTPPLIIVARFFKIRPRQDWLRRLDNPFWLVTHRRRGTSSAPLLRLPWLSS